MNSKLTVFGVVVAVCAFACGANGADVDCSKPPPPMDPRTCCDVPELTTDEVDEVCDEFAKPPGPMPKGMNSNRPHPHPHPHPPPHPHHHMHPCFAECMFNKTEIMNEDETINEENLQKYLAEALEDLDDLIPVVEQSFKTCTAKIAEFEAKRAEKMQQLGVSPPPPLPSDRMSRQRCHPRRTMLLGCVTMESINNCPTSMWTDSEECNNFRAFFNACKRY